MASLIAVTLPQYERRVELALKQRGLHCYLPRCRPVASKRAILLMPRYIFAGPPEAWAEVRKINGVSRLLRRQSDNQPALVQDHELDHLREYEDEYGLIKLPRKPRFRRGQRVRITLGVLTGLVGVYQGLSKKSDKVLLTLGQVILPEGNLVLE